MQVEKGEKRVFLPEFVEALTMMGFEIFIEEGYGSRLGFTHDEYQRGNGLIHICTREEAFAQSYVMVLRCPRRVDFDLIKPGTCLISMLHYPTRPARVEMLERKQIKSISLDSIVNDNNIRLVENMKAVAWNGLETAYDLFQEQWPTLHREDGEPWKVLVLGTGMVGKHAVDAGTKLGNIERNNEHIQNHGPGAMVWSIGRNITNNPGIMQRLFSRIDILVDASNRRNPSRPIIQNDWISWLPDHAVIVDLSVDPYTLDTQPPVVRGIEGIPQGNLDQFSFYPDDPNWTSRIPLEIPTKHRRTTVSCYSWPGIHPEACMRHYAQQLTPMMEILGRKEYDELSLNGDYFERALYRATLDYFLNTNPRK